MKKLLLTLAIISLFVSCDLDGHYQGRAENNTATYNVTFKISNGPGEITLNPGESKSLELSVNHPNPSELLYYSPQNRVSVKSDSTNSTWIFYDRTAYPVKILNLTGDAGKLTAGNWMEEISFTNLSIEQNNPNWLVYSNNPSFVAITTTGFLLQVDKTFNDNKFLVTVH